MFNPLRVSVFSICRQRLRLSGVGKPKRGVGNQTLKKIMRTNIARIARMEILSRRISGISVNNRGGTLSTHLQRWGWMDGVEDVNSCRVYRTRQDLKLLLESSNNFAVEWDLEGRLSVFKSRKSKGLPQPHLIGATRLRPARRPVALP